MDSVINPLDFNNKVTRLNTACVLALYLDYLQLHFPAFHYLPSEHYIDRRYYSERGLRTGHWCFLAEIKETIPWLRPMYHVTDKTGFQSLVAFHLEDRGRFPAISAKCTDGYTMCIMYANQHIFVDGQQGVRVEDETAVKVCS